MFWEKSLLYTLFLSLGCLLAQAQAQPLSMFTAAQSGPPELVRRLVTDNFAVNPRNADGETPLMLAARDNPDPEVVRTLLQLGADAQARNLHGQQALHYALIGVQPVEHSRLLLEHSSLDMVEASLPTLLLETSSESQGQLLSLWQQAGADLNSRDAEGRTPLVQAVIAQHLEPVRSLVVLGVDLDAQDHQGKTAYIHAAQGDNATLLRYLRDVGVRTDISDASGKTARDYLLENASLNTLLLREEF